MRRLCAAWLAGLLAKPVLGGGLVGYGIYPYNPYCAFACLRSLSNMLQCSSGIGESVTTSPQCRADDTPWLTTLAWCMHIECAEYHVATSELESFWEQQCTGDPTVAPKWGYTTSLEHIAQPPTQELTDTDEILNTTALVSPLVYKEQYNALSAVQREVTVESSYGIAILVIGFGTPIILTWLGYVPYMSGVIDKIKPYLVYPRAIGKYQVRPLPYLLGNVPTIGQSLYIIMFIILNVILTTVNYESRQPHAWYANQGREIVAYVAYRTGVFAFVLAPLVILFSSRNNILLWMTNWSYSTFLLLHRWVSHIFAVYALVHSILFVILWKAEGIYLEQSTEAYWIWGAVATVATSILVVTSGLYVRRLSYEFFLITHILLTIFVVVGYWYHIELWLPTWGWRSWLYAAFAVWDFDRLVRIGRILTTGVHHAKVTNLGEGYVRVDIAGIYWGSDPGKHVYTYFPTLNPLRPWENHPFSVLPMTLLQSSNRRPSSEKVGSTTGLEADREKHDGLTAWVKNTPDNRITAGLTLFIKKSTGMTKFLQAHDGLLTLLEGPYANNATKEILRCDRLLLVGGRIGITSLLPWIANHSNIKLCWSVKETAKCLKEAVDVVLSNIVEKDLKIGSRLDISELLAEEVDSGWGKVGVVVSGPGGLCDDVRAAVTAAGKQGKTVFELEIDTYS